MPARKQILTNKAREELGDLIPVLKQREAEAAESAKKHLDEHLAKRRDVTP